MIQFSKGSYAYDILYNLALVVEFPYESLDFFGNRRSVLRVINQMNKERYISINHEGELKSIYLLKKGADKVLELFGQEVYDYYMFVSENRTMRGGEQNVWRNHRTAEVSIFLHLNGSKVIPSEKPKLVLSSKDIEEKYRMPSKDSYYYTSREFKSLDEEQLYKISFTRIRGLYITPRDVFAVYNTNKGAIKWSRQGEYKIQIVLNNIINSSFDVVGSHSTDNAIIFGKGYEAAEKIVNREGGGVVDGVFEYLSFEQTYQNIYYVPLDDFGKVQLALLHDDSWEEKLIENIIPKTFNTEKSTMNVDCHAYDPKKKSYVLFFLEGNMRQLLSFLSASKFYTDSEFMIIGFSWQKEFLESITQDSKNIKVTAVTTRSVVSLLD